MIARQCDYFATKKNRNASQLVGGKNELNSVHTNYSNIGLDDPANKTFVEGKATDILGALRRISCRW